MKASSSDDVPSLRSIGPRQWKHVYRLLGLVLLADERVIPEEVSAYIVKTIALAKSVDPFLIVTERMLLDWFILNKEGMVADVRSLLYDSIIIETQANLRPLKEKQAVIKTMIEIGLAGGEYSARKQMFIRKTMLYWNIPLTEEAVILNEIGNTRQKGLSCMKLARTNRS